MSLAPRLCADDTSFGPGSRCRDLDFTVFFQATILSITPDCLFISYAILRVFLLWRQPAKISRPGWILLGPKIILALLLISSNAAVTAFQFVRLKNQAWPAVAFAASPVSLVASLFLMALVVCEHYKSLAPSTLVICYTGLIKGLFGSTALRTAQQLHLLETDRPLFVASAVTTSGYFAISLAELFEKRHLLNEKYKKYPIEMSSSFLSRALYLGLIPLLWRGRNTRLTLDDLDLIPENNKAAPARQRLEAALKSTSPGSTYLFRATIKAFGPSFYAPIIPRVLLMLATFAQPLLVNNMIAFVSSSEPASRGWAIVGGFVCVYCIIPMTTALYWEKIYAVTVQYRAALVGCIYDKALRLASHEARAVGSGAASTSVDVERICEGLEWTHELWASIISIGIAIVILYYQATWPAFMPVAVICVILGITSAFAKNVGQQQSKWMAATDKRIKFISSIINHFLPLKWAAYEPYMEMETTALRNAEVDRGKDFCNLIIITSTLSNIASPLCTVAALSTYAAVAATGHGKGPLDATRLFSIATTVALLGNPINFLGQMLPLLLAAYASLKRIQKFLRLEEKLRVTSNSDENVEKFEPCIRLQGSFGWTKESDQVLHDINIQLPSNQLTVCVGSVAAGKTTLLMSLLGETVPSRGITERIAYAAQDTFIFPGTVRDNIVCGQVFDEELYSNVLAACALSVDLRRMPNGDHTKVGDKGLTLSGGQKQRIGLARAAYAQAPITLLDDTFSALDAETEAHVFEAVLGPSGILANRSVVLVTHNVYHTASAAWVLVLDEGRITHQGTHTQVQEAGYDLSGQIDTPLSASQSKKLSEALDIKQEKQDDEEDDETTKQFASRGWAPYMFFFRASGWHRVFIAASFLFLWRALMMASQGYLKEWSESNGRHYQAWIGGYLAFAVAGFLTSLISLGYYLLGMTITSGRNIHKAELEAFLSSPPSIILTMSPGRLINRFSQDIFTLDFTFPLAMVNGIVLGLTLVGTVILLIISAPYLALLVPPLAGIYALILKFYLGTSKQLQALEAASKSPLYRIFGTTLGGLETIRAFKLQSFFQTQNDLYLNQSQGPYYFRFSGQAFLRTALSSITMIVSIGLASLAVGLRHTTSPSLLGVALSNLTNLTLLLSALLASWASIENGTVGLQRLHEIVGLSPEEDPKASVTTLPKESAWPTQGSVVFEDFGMRYKDDLAPVLRNINLRIRGGQKLGICGRTGAGKTSMLLALFRACPLTNGKILVDGIDISGLSLRSLRSALSVVSQDPFLWHASVRNNLDIEQACTDETIWAALQRVGMSEAVSNLPEKLETVLEEASLSRGQRQLLCMARVLIRRRQIVILDEATSSMDFGTDEKIREIVQTDLAHQTIIAVAHRIATICDSDIVVVLDDGQIVESGQPQELLGNPDSKFAKLAASQGIGPESSKSDAGVDEVN